MIYNLPQAALATGKSKSTIFRAVTNGTVSGEKTETGGWRIDAAELHRVFPRVEDAVAQNVPADAKSNNAALAATREKLELLEQLAASYLETITDLRGRLDRESAERRAVQRQLTLLMLPGTRSSWWRRLFGRSAGHPDGDREVSQHDRE